MYHAVSLRQRVCRVKPVDISQEVGFLRQTTYALGYSIRAFSMSNRRSSSSGVFSMIGITSVSRSVNYDWTIGQFGWDKDERTAQSLPHSTYPHALDHLKMGNTPFFTRPKQGSHDRMLRVGMYAGASISLLIGIEEERSTCRLFERLHGCR
jgi:hypothetical protein